MATPTFQGSHGRAWGLWTGVRRTPIRLELPVGTRQLILTSIVATLPVGSYRFVMVAGGGGGGGDAAGLDTGHSGGGGGAGGVAEGTLVSDGNTPITFTVGAGGTGVSAAQGNAGGNSTIVVTGGTFYGGDSSTGGGGGGPGSGANIGYPGVPGISIGVSTAPTVWILIPGFGGSLGNTAAGSPTSFLGWASGSLPQGPSGGGAGAAPSASLGGNSGFPGNAASIVTGWPLPQGAVGTGTTGTTTGQTGISSAANSGGGGAGAGGSFTGGAAAAGGAGGSGWIELWRIA